MKEFLLYLWQLPQHVVAFIILFVNASNYSHVEGSCLYFVKHLENAGISLGKYIIFDSDVEVTSTDIAHELGHQKQSLYLGWLYLFIVGIPSALHNLVSRKTECNYYHFWTEKWADRLGGVKR